MPATGRNILITGAGRGIGRATAILCGKRGWSAGINFVSNETAAAETVAAVIAAGGKAVAVKGDVSDEDDVAAMFDAVEQAFGPVTGLVNNAGVVARASRFVDIDTERMRRIFDVNVLGAALAAREALRRMAKSRGGKGGAIVNISSVAARLGSPGEYVDYAASKGALDTLTIGLAREYGPDGVRVNAVRPGMIDTDIHAEIGNPDRAHILGAESPLGRAGAADEVAEAIVWLLSDAASYVTGAFIDAAGGR